MKFHIYTGPEITLRDGSGLRYGMTGRVMTFISDGGCRFFPHGSVMWAVIPTKYIFKL